MLTTEVENYPGFAEGIAGPELMQAMRAQAERAGATFLTEDVATVDFSTRPFRLRTAGGRDVTAQAVIIATGATAKLLGLPSEAALLGRGVSTCATCDGFFFRNRDVVVVGGGDTAMEEALYLANLVRSVTVVHRRDRLGASRVMQERALAIRGSGLSGTPKSRRSWARSGSRACGSATAGRRDHGAGGRGCVHRHRPPADRRAVPRPPGDGRRGLPLIRDLRMSSVEGVFVAGDVHDHVYRQAVTAAGFGAMAAIDAARWLQRAVPVSAAAAA